MAPTTKGTGKNIEAETQLQAVVLADSFNERFSPITLDKPRVWFLFSVSKDISRLLVSFTNDYSFM